SRRLVHQDVVLEPGPYVELEIRDTGIGMDEETSARAFEPFFTTKPAGTGLGLSTVYGIVAQSGGQIEVDSRLWQGSTFRLLLPGTTREREVETRDTTPPATGETVSETILLVDDEETVLDLVATMLERLGYTVVRAGTPAECLTVEADYAGAIDLLLTDIVMPGASGEELAAAIVERRPGIAVLFMSGYADPELADGRLAEDAKLLLRKPFGTAELAWKVRRALATRPAPATASSSS